MSYCDTSLSFTFIKEIKQYGTTLHNIRNTYEALCQFNLIY